MAACTMIFEQAWRLQQHFFRQQSLVDDILKLLTESYSLVFIASHTLNSNIFRYCEGKHSKMEPHFILNGEINIQKYSRSPDHYENMEQTFDWLKTSPNIKEYQTQSLVALIDEDLRRAMLVATIAYPKRPTSRTIIGADRYNRIKTINVGVRSVRYLLSTMNGFTIVLSIGTFEHDTCLFIRKVENQYESVWFNPTAEKRVKNVEKFLENFNMRACFAYNAPDGNRSGQCSGYVWRTMTSFLRGKSGDPFNRNGLLMKNATTKSYE